MNRESELQSCHLSAAGFQLPASDRLRRIARTARAVIVRVLGVPDYDAYLVHHRAAHPHCTPIVREQFISERLMERYSRPGGKCC
jgi:uncharacterized short protein YbdD (DUF466 family)